MAINFHRHLTVCVHSLQFLNGYFRTLFSEHLCYDFFILMSCAQAPRGLPVGLIDSFKAIHTAVYEVYQMGVERDQIHDLSGIYLGEALTQAYILHFQTIVHMAQDETAIDVRQVDYTTVKLDAHTLEGVSLNVDWSVGGM